MKKLAYETNRFAEKRAGVATEEPISLRDLGVPVENRIWHHPSHYWALRRAFRRLDPGPDDVLIDFGSGLGRVLAVAAALPIRKVIGVELSEVLVERSRANLAGYRGPRRAGSIVVIQADALDYEIPDDLTIVYMFCPFTGTIFDDVFRRLLESVDRRPRVLRMVYNYPLEHVHVIGSGRVELLDVNPGQLPPRPDTPEDVMLTYLLLPETGHAALPEDAPTPTRAVKRHKEWLGPYNPGFDLHEPETRR